MANYCLSGLKVTGSKVDLKKFKEFAVEDKNFAQGEVRILSEQKFIPLPRKLKDEEKWCKENWGTYPGFCYPEIEKETNRYIIYKFDTKWSPIYPVIHKMGEMFPTLSFYYGFWESGAGFGGRLVMKKGKLTKQLWEKCLCSEALAEKLKKSAAKKLKVSPS